MHIRIKETQIVFDLAMCYLLSQGPRRSNLERQNQSMELVGIRQKQSVNRANLSWWGDDVSKDNDTIFQFSLCKKVGESLSTRNKISFLLFISKVKKENDQHWSLTRKAMVGSFLMPSYSRLFAL